MQARGGGGGRGGGAKDPGGGDEDIDAILQELKITPAEGAAARGAATARGSGGAQPASAALLGVDVRRLRGEDELRRIFGAGVIEAVDRQDAAESGCARGFERHELRGS
jgi:hypothetical protein